MRTKRAGGGFSLLKSPSAKRITRLSRLFTALVVRYLTKRFIGDYAPYGKRD